MRDLTYPPIIVSAKVAFRLLGIRFQLRGTEHVPRTGGAVLALNHISYVDFVFGGFAAQPSRRLLRFMSKRELFDHRWTGPLMRSLHHIEVDRAAGQASLQAGVDALRAGEVVGIFPEATISRSMDLEDLKTGAVRMAAEAGVPVVPAILWGTQRMYTKDHPRDVSRGHTVAITVGSPFHPGEDADAATADLRSRMVALLDETVAAYPLAPAGQWWAPARLGGAAPTPEESARLDAEEKAARAARRAARDT